MTTPIVFRSEDRLDQHVYAAASNLFDRPYLDKTDPLVERLIEFRLALLNNGWPCIPVKGKDMLLSLWTSGDITPERVRAETLESTNMVRGTRLGLLNTGIRCGYIVGSDNDLTDAEHAAGVDEIVAHFLGPTPLRRVGSKGAMLVYRNERPITKLTLTGWLPGVDRKTTKAVRLYEILGDGQQFVAFGRHPKGMNYTWDGPDPYVFRAADAPEVTPEQLQECFDGVKELLRGVGYTLTNDKSREQVREVTDFVVNRNEDRGDDIPEMCRAALAAIPNDVSREEWIDTCMAIKDAGLSYYDWSDWCSRWIGGRNTEGAMRQAWNGCNPRSITYRTLLWKADQVNPYWRTKYREQKTRERNERYLADMRDWLK